MQIRIAIRYPFLRRAVFTKSKGHEYRRWFGKESLLQVNACSDSMCSHRTTILWHHHKHRRVKCNKYSYSAISVKALQSAGQRISINIHQWLDKKKMMYIHTVGYYLSILKAWNAVTWWMSLDNIITNEMRHRRTNITWCHS